MGDFEAFMRDSQMRIEHALDGYLPNGAARPERLTKQCDIP